MDFEQLLKRAGILRVELAKRLGITAGAISKWGKSPPRYAVAYLELLVEYNRLRP